MPDRMKLMELARKYPRNVSFGGERTTLLLPEGTKQYSSQKEYETEYNHHIESAKRAESKGDLASRFYHRTIADAIVRDRRQVSPESKKLCYEFYKAKY